MARKQVSIVWDEGAGATLILHSDGVGTRWNLEHDPGLERCHPGIVAALLYRDFGRGRDDACVLVQRWPEER